MSLAGPSGNSEANGASRTSRVLYAACGLVYRTGCGPSEHVIALARELGALPGVRLTVLFAGITDPPPTGPFTLESLNEKGLEAAVGLETDALVLGLNPLRYLAHRRRVLDFAARSAGGHDAIIERMWGYGGILARRFRTAGLTVILEENGPISWKEGLRRPGDLIRILYLFLSRTRLKRCYRTGRSVVVQTRHLQERLIREFDVVKDRLEVIPNGVDLERFREVSAQPEAKEGAPLVLVYAGTLDAHHDLRPLVRAALKSRRPIEVRILGSGPMRPALESLAEGLGPDRLRFHGRVPPKVAVRHLADADLCVAAYSPEIHERSGFQFSPLKLLEYAAAGRCVVVAGPAPGSGPVVQGVNGFFIANETGAWLDLLDRLPGREALQEMGLKGRDFARQRGWDRAAAGYLQLVENRFSQPVVAPLPYANPENRFITRLHDHLEQRGVRLLDPGDLSLRWLKAHNSLVDLVHVHWPESHFHFPNPAYSFLKWLHLMRKLRAAERGGARIVWTVHNLESHDRTLRLLDRRLRRHLLRRAGLILLGDGSLSALESSYGLRPVQPFTVIRHGHYMGCYGDILDQAQCREDLDLPGAGKIFLFLGNVRHYKGVEILARVFSSLDAPSALLVVAGKIVDRAVGHRIAALAARHPDRIRFQPGFVPDERIGKLLQAADVQVLPYREIHMSGTLLMALSYGRPILAPDLGLLREYLPEGAGSLYDPTDPTGLEKALLDAMGWDALKMGRKGRAFMEQLEWNGIAEEHRRFYARLAGPARIGPPADR